MEIGKTASSPFSYRSKSVIKHHDTVQAALLSNTERINNKLKIDSETLQIGNADEFNMSNSNTMARSNFLDYSRPSRDINVFDMSHVGRIKQHNFEISPRGVSPEFLTEKNYSFNYKGSPAIPKLTPERIRQIRDPNFEIRY
eukprot:CAMPEP_0170551092 /NCGR_PEP_ID=MMETSP0211-20121228/9117_1 /TAXON_ID=311385 /ORGANISM="Pseudokeronopsis sp., Strain OXSARD2" /LENGTH=141 /DNA_ID=CAMNT_0010858039 /DNA_START=213 /DNA_END=638 /DNA_ORIENTATION=+